MTRFARLGLVVARTSLFAFALVLFSTDARGDDDDAKRAHVPMPEPIFTETVTDLDGDDAGEVEIEANLSLFRARRGGAYDWTTSAEIEWLATRRLGLRLEPVFARARNEFPGTPANELSLSGGMSWKLWQDFERDAHLQIELLGRIPFDESQTVQPGDPALPLSLDLRGGFRRGLVTLRHGIGVGVLGDAEHAPIRFSAAILAPFEPSYRFGFFGMEVDVDGARRYPMVVALNLVPDLTPRGLPFRIGLAVPWSVGQRETEPSLGIFLRLYYVSGREAEFGRGSR